MTKCMVQLAISAAARGMLEEQSHFEATRWALAGSARLFSSWPGEGPTRGARASRARAAGTVSNSSDGGHLTIARRQLTGGRRANRSRSMMSRALDLLRSALRRGRSAT